MKCHRLIPALALASQLAVGTAFAVTDPDRMTASPGKTANPPVLRGSEPEDTIGLVLPGPPPGSTPPDAQPNEPKSEPHQSVFVRDAPPEDPDRPILRRSDPPYPAEMQQDSAFFLQKQIGQWTLSDAIIMMGEPARQRPAYDGDQTENGEIDAFSDPTGRYKEVELDFEKDTWKLREVFVYPWKMTWQECRRLWGNQVQATEANKGRMFYSYLNRKLDVLVDASGKVISLGLY
jgi:hypothetical protein